MYDENLPARQCRRASSRGSWRCSGSQESQTYSPQEQASRSCRMYRTPQARCCGLGSGWGRVGRRCDSWPGTDRRFVLHDSSSRHWAHPLYSGTLPTAARIGRYTIPGGQKRKQTHFHFRFVYTDKLGCYQHTWDYSGWRLKHRNHWREVIAERQLNLILWKQWCLIFTITLYFVIAWHH